jgi:hypothetical protein
MPPRHAPDALTTLADMTAVLGRGEPAAFPSAWLRRACAAEFARLTIEDAYADPSSEPYERAHEALNALPQSEDWLPPQLSHFLTAVHALGVAPSPMREEVETALTVDGRRLCLLEWRPQTEVPMTVSNAYALAVKVIERSLAEPKYCQNLISAFSRGIDKVRKATGATGLLFIEKEAGPLGAVTMLSSLVQETGMPATVYRESRWAGPLAGRTPDRGDRLIVVYDLIVTGAGILRAAEAVENAVGASCVGAVVLSGHGPQRNSITTATGQVISIEALGWDTRTVSPDAPAFDDANEPADQFRGSSASLKETEMKTERAGAIGPGSYTRDTLPEISEGAKRILARLKARPRAAEQESSAEVVRRRQPDVIIGVRPAERLAPSARDAVAEHLGPGTTFRKS